MANRAKGARKKYVDRVLVAERPWSVLTASQRENRLDTVAWHEGRDIFAKDILKHTAKVVRSRAESSNEATMKLLIKAYKHGIDLVAVPPGTLSTTPVEQWGKFPRAVTIDETAVPVATAVRQMAPKKAMSATPVADPDPLAAPPVVGNFVDLEDILNRVVRQHAGPVRSVRRDDAERMPKVRGSGRQETPAGGAPGRAEASEAAQEPELAFEATRGRGRPSERPQFHQAHSVGQEEAVGGEACGAIPEPGEVDEAGAATRGDPHENPSNADLKEIGMIRDKLVVKGRVRLDIEALAVYLLAPSYFAIATGLDPEPWQSRFLDSYALRLGCLASRQSGKSIITARKAVCFAMTSPATTTLILAPTLRQSSELLLKCSGVAQVAGLKIAQLSQFQLVLADGQPGAMSRDRLPARIERG